MLSPLIIPQAMASTEGTTMMSFAISLLSLLLSRPAKPSRRRRNSSGPSRPRLEALEDRCLPSVTINEFSIPGTDNRPNWIKAGPDGNLWFNQNAPGEGSTLGRITPAGQVTEIGFALPEDITQFAFAKDGNIWFGEGTHISEATPQGAVLHNYDVPSAHNAIGNSLHIALGWDGNIWYTEDGYREAPYVVGQITPAGVPTEFAVPFRPEEIVAGPDGNVWFEGAGGSTIGRVTPTGDVATFNISSYPSFRGLTSGPNGNLWMSSTSNGAIAVVEVNPAGQPVAAFSYADAPQYLALGPDGNLWAIEAGPGISADGGTHIDRITPQGGITEYPIPTLNAEADTITAGPDGNIWFTEYLANQIGEVVLNHSTTNVAASLAKPLYGDTVTLTATVSNISDPVAPSGSVEFYDGGTDLGPGTSSGSSGNQGTWTLTASALAVGSHNVTAVYSGTTDLVGSQGGTSITVIAPASLSGTVFEDLNDNGQVDFGEKGISGVTITLSGTDDLNNTVSPQQQLTDADGAYVFLHLRPGSYFLSETQPAGFTQGIDTVGTAGGSLVATDEFSVSLKAGVDGLNYNYGEQPPAGVQPGQTAGIGFWNNKNGQALIKALNGSSASTHLGNWLATSLPNTFGSHAGSNNLTGESNADIAALFQQDFLMKGVKLDAQVLATALAVYATSSTLDPTQVAASYGFTVTSAGSGTATFNVGSNGDAFGVANNTAMTLLDLLLAADAQAVNGVLYNGNTTKRNEANAVFSAINQDGSIS
jgi:streptogramin lyase